MPAPKPKQLIDPITTPTQQDQGSLSDALAGSGPAIELQRLLLNRIAAEQEGSALAWDFPGFAPPRRSTLSDPMEKAISQFSRALGPIALAVAVLALVGFFF